ncbi:DUF3644 domain-containing protein [Aurantimicrobium minutum]|uniref:DUF3644 domain-containing protein n=1 Tax=Aurantimicrobium minutum TaxID=708131 RepID=UPI0024763427|nr:DUF3644 domain-containing protein [Aurantimicrobium minutum]MDH6423124.1 hypothetical protein [Aurantimicrobium minutum]
MLKEAKLLKQKAINSLLLSIDHFNGVNDRGRLEAVLIFLDHSFEMLLKAGILTKGGKIRNSREKETIGFEKSLRKALSESAFLTEEQVLVLQTINGLRDAAQHHLVDLSESQLYFHCQSGVTLFRDILLDVFNEDLAKILPPRALPVSTIAMSDPLEMFISDAEKVKQLLKPGRRKKAEAEAMLRGLAIMDGALQGQPVQPSARDLNRLGTRLVGGEKFAELFPGIGSVNFSTDSTGSQISLRILKNEGVPVTIVDEGTPGAAVVAVRRVNELGYYNLGHKDLTQKVGLTSSKTSAAIALLNLKDDPDCYNEVVLGKTRFQRYSQKAIARILELKEEIGAEGIWQQHKLQSKK